MSEKAKKPEAKQHEMKIEDVVDRYRTFRNRVTLCIIQHGPMRVPSDWVEELRFLAAQIAEWESENS